MEQNNNEEVKKVKKTITIEVDEDVDIEKLVQLAKNEPNKFKINYDDNTVAKVKQYLLDEQERIKKLPIEEINALLNEKEKANMKSIIIATIGIILCALIAIACLVVLFVNNTYSAFYGVGLAILVILFSSLALVSDIKEKNKLKEARLNEENARKFLMPEIPPYLDNGANGEQVVGNPDQGVIFKNKIKK